MSKNIFINLFDPKRSQNKKCSEFIEIRYFNYVDLNFNVENDFYQICTNCARPNWSQNEKCSEFIEI